MDRTLSPTRIHILTSFYWDGATLDEIGREVGLTKEAVRHNISRALYLLRRPENKKICEAGLEHYKAKTLYRKAVVAIERKGDDIAIDEDGLDRSVETMPLYGKTKRQCLLHGVNTVRELGAMTLKEIAAWPSIGDSAINQLIRVMDEEYGIQML